MYKTVKPFIKWAGGKSQLLDTIRKKYPEKIERYCEPFVGGGAVLLDVLVNYQPKEVLINDINPELINTYTQIRNNPEKVIELLSEMQSEFWQLESEDRKIYYYFQRKKFNELIKLAAETEEKAALFVFMNKTCFNGLYRVNGKGLYNVPIGSYKKPPICDAENIRLISGLLQGVNIQCGDYSECYDFIDSSTFVYIDPPYRPLSVTSSFTSYAKTEFGDEQQIQLGHFTEKISKKGAKIVASNSDPKNADEDDNFFDDIYKMFFIDRVAAARIINSNSKRRGMINELLIYNC
ncbi:MAG: DNA adenine methylase [Clostridia bacterium]|nr:DNA adenine methylase [Clostridia bacterium]